MGCNVVTGKMDERDNSKPRQLFSNAREPPSTSSHREHRRPLPDGAAAGGWDLVGL
jgi:hypothetical protein